MRVPKVIIKIKIIVTVSTILSNFLLKTLRAATVNATVLTHGIAIYTFIYFDSALLFLQT